MAIYYVLASIIWYFYFARLQTNTDAIIKKREGIIKQSEKVSTSNPFGLFLFRATLLFLM